MALQCKELLKRAITLVGTYRGLVSIEHLGHETYIGTRIKVQGAIHGIIETNQRMSGMGSRVGQQDQLIGNHRTITLYTSLQTKNILSTHSPTLKFLLPRVS